LNTRKTKWLVKMYCRMLFMRRNFTNSQEKVKIKKKKHFVFEILLSK